MVENGGIVFGNLYANALAELTSPDLSKIKLLRDLAKENVDKAPYIVATITRHLSQCAPSMRLAALYLVDCLLKNVPRPYMALFEQDLRTMFEFVWSGADNDPGLRAKLIKLAGTWETQRTLPASIQSAIQATIHPHTPPTLPATFSTCPAPVPTQPPSPAPQQLLWPPPLPSLSLPPQQPILLPPPLLPQQQQQHPFTFPTDFQAFMTSQGWGNLPMSVPQHPSQSPPTLLLPGGQLLQGPPMPLSVPPPSLPLSAPPMQQATPQHGQDLASALESLSRQLGVQVVPIPTGTHTGAGDVAAAGSAQQLPAYKQQVPVGSHLPLHPPPCLPPNRMTITQQNIKEYCQPAVDHLLASSDATRSRFLDLQFLRNRRAKSSTLRSRPWFTSVEQWLEGTRTDHQDIGLNYFNEEGEQTAKGAESALEPAPQLVEEDPSQPTCAISGEAFERLYDPDTDKWYYEDAAVLWGDQASNAGVMDGSIVKVHCLAGAPPPLSSSLGIGPAARQEGMPVDDVMPALADVAAGAAPDSYGSATPAETTPINVEAAAPAPHVSTSSSAEKRKFAEVEAPPVQQQDLGSSQVASAAEQQAQVDMPALKRTNVAK